MKSIEFASLPEYQDWKSANATSIATWMSQEETFLPAGQLAFSVPGFCAVCAQPTDFQVTTDYGVTDPSGKPMPNWREQLACPRCRMGNRVRAALNLAVGFGMEPASRIYITEQFGSVYRWLRGHYRYVQGSEYLYPTKPSGFRRYGINHEDVQALSLATASVDFLLTFDVLEHIPDPHAAIRSFARVLRPGGRLVMTVPFTLDKYETTVRAAMRGDGTIEHFLPIEIHGNPLDPVNGSLCFRHFGWDTLDQLKEAGFDQVRVYVYRDAELGHLGVQSLISAVKVDA
ncbi:MAG: class I SAM-dependent methyltransferase [Actinomycetota bacterium]